MFENREGQSVPAATLAYLDNHSKLQKITSDEIFKGKTVVVFSLPGAFTPTCSSSHVPGYNALAGVLKQHGVDDIVCLSVNDAFVMHAWSQDQHADNVRFLADGNGEFTAGMGLLVDKSALGFGKRSWRYSMLVRDGVIAKMFIEPQKEGDPFEVSDADTMLNYLAPNANKASDISVFTKAGCSFCAQAKALLKEKGLPYHEIEIPASKVHQILKNVTGIDTTPQIYIKGTHIGGTQQLAEYLRRNR